MSDLISREQAIDAVRATLLAWSYMPEWRDTKIIGAVKRLPPIQPKIVRCKDCGHYRHGLCMKASMCVNKSENGFCDWAERREVNNESN